jgi:hypothetical protein
MVEDGGHLRLVPPPGGSRGAAIKGAPTSNAAAEKPVRESRRRITPWHPTRRQPFAHREKTGRKQGWPNQTTHGVGPYSIPVSPKLTEAPVSINHNEFNISF